MDLLTNWRAQFNRRISLYYYCLLCGRDMLRISHCNIDSRSDHMIFKYYNRRLKIHKVWSVKSHDVCFIFDVFFYDSSSQPFPSNHRYDSIAVELNVRKTKKLNVFCVEHVMVSSYALVVDSVNPLSWTANFNEKTKTVVANNLVTINFVVWYILI